MSQDGRRIRNSQFISGGPRTHHLSPFLESEIGHSDFQTDELIFSSSLLWQRSVVPFQPPRFTIGFPEEWNAFSSGKDQIAMLDQISLDFWIFRKLNQSEYDSLIQILEIHSSYRIVVAPSYIFRWSEFLSDPKLLSLKNCKRVLISFLPRNDRLSPFLRQHDVLHAIKELDDEIEIMNLNLGAGPKLSPETWAAAVSASSRSFVLIIKKLDEWGLNEFTLSLVSALDFLVSGRVRRLFATVAYFLNGTFNLLWHQVYPLLKKTLLWPLFKPYWFFEYQFKKFSRSRQK